ncbi:class I SAM-dependent methyltransferase [Streptomyces tricolor]|nr:class I SAM-dependent methyltransferase [Streptomyces tricolor]
MGRGAQALRLARLGHQVTGGRAGRDDDRRRPGGGRPEPEGIRERVRLVQGDGRDTGVHFLPGSFDVVLCHAVLMYVEEPDPLVAGLARMLAPGGLLSLLVRNGDALAMRPGLSGDWAGALAAFDTTAYRNRLGRDVPRRPAGRPHRHARRHRRPAARLVRRPRLHGHGGGRRGDARRPGDAARGGGAGRAHGPVPRGGGAAASVRGTGLSPFGGNSVGRVITLG